ncbi:hypothetical protein [Actinacidiphila yanglinensis]|nr:hypothetical protein [Actinacidiphila yanglinensis]
MGEGFLGRLGARARRLTGGGAGPEPDHMWGSKRGPEPRADSMRGYTPDPWPEGLAASPHHWRECEPVILTAEREDSEAASVPPWEAEVGARRTAEAMKAVIARLQPSEQDEFRLAFHRMCCLNSRDSHDLLVTEQVVGMVRAELQRPEYS